MRNTTLPLRIAYFQALTPLIVDGITIPVYDEQVPQGVNPPPFMDCIQAYVIITDQQEIETTNDKCQFRKDSNISFKVVTKFNGKTGRKLPVELINDAILTKVHSFYNIIPQINPDFQISRIRLSVNVFIAEYGMTETAFTYNMIFNNEIYQN